MSYKSQVERNQNDWGYYLNFKLEYQDENKQWQPLDLSGYSALKVFIGEAGNPTSKVVGDCEIAPEDLTTDGKCRYKVQDGDFDEGDKTYEMEVEVSYGVPVVEVVTGKGASIYISPELAETES